MKATRLSANESHWLLNTKGNEAQLIFLDKTLACFYSYYSALYSLFLAVHTFVLSENTTAVSTDAGVKEQVSFLSPFP